FTIITVNYLSLPNKAIEVYVIKLFDTILCDFKNYIAIIDVACIFCILLQNHIGSLNHHQEIRMKVLTATSEVVIRRITDVRLVQHVFKDVVLYPLIVCFLK